MKENNLHHLHHIMFLLQMLHETFFLTTFWPELAVPSKRSFCLDEAFDGYKWKPAFKKVWVSPLLIFLPPGFERFSWGVTLFQHSKTLEGCCPYQPSPWHSTGASACFATWDHLRRSKHPVRPKDSGGSLCEFFFLVGTERKSRNTQKMSLHGVGRLPEWATSMCWMVCFYRCSKKGIWSWDISDAYSHVNGVSKVSEMNCFEAVSLCCTVLLYWHLPHYTFCSSSREGCFSFYIDFI